MLSLEQQVISLELSKKLKELGVPQESQFYHVNAKSLREHVFENEIWMIAHISQTTGMSKDWYSAFTASELLNLLPCIDNNEPQLIRGYLKGESQLTYCCRYGWEDDQNKDFVDINPVNSIAKMLIHLIENNLINTKYFLPNNAYDLIIGVKK